MGHGRMARRRVLALGLGGIVGVGLGSQSLIGGRKAMAQGTPQGTPETVVYVSNAGSKEVFVLAMNRATGALEPYWRWRITNRFGIYLCREASSGFGRVPCQVMVIP
jgi:hypothetical protein